MGQRSRTDQTRPITLTLSFKSDGSRALLTHDARGFTLIDVLVSMAVITVLIGILLPGLSHVNQKARRVACASNVRQIGLGVQMYADDHNGFLVPSIFVAGWSRNSTSAPEQMDRIRLDDSSKGLWGNRWDGIGRLFSEDYLAASKIFYCPSHRGEHPFSRYVDIFGDAEGGIVSNYQYRGVSPDGSKYLDFVQPKQTAIVCDGIRTRLDFNHSSGMNVLRADQSVDWFQDDGRELFNSLPDDDGSSVSAQSAWQLLDSNGTHR